MKIQVKVYASQYGSVIASSFDMESVGYSLITTSEVEFDDSLIPEIAAIHRNALMNNLEKMTEKFEKDRRAIIEELDKLEKNERI